VTSKAASTDMNRFRDTFNVSRETMARLTIYAQMLSKWQQRINLVGPSTMQTLWIRHFADSLELGEHAPEPGKNWLDIGTGAGFPGLVLAACGQQKKLQIDLVESNARKCAFLREVSRQMKVPANIHNCRIETIDSQTIQNMSLDVVTARALAPLAELLKLAEKAFMYGAVGIFPRGQDIEDELTACAKYWKMKTEIAERNYDLPGKVLVVHECRRYAT